jgi:hypothetical protein
MTGDSRVRFCDHCNLNVYNLSELSRAGAERLIASTEGRLCARLFRRADGTVLTKDCPVGLRALRMRVSKRAAAVFAAIASISAAAFGQQSTAKDSKTACTPQTRITQTTSAHAASPISGFVSDISGAAIPDAQILLTNIDTNETSNTSSNKDGRFKYDSLAAGNYSLKIEAIGFKSHVATNIVFEGNHVLDIEMILEVKDALVTMGVVDDASYYRDYSTSSPTHTFSGDLLRSLPIPK